MTPSVPTEGFPKVKGTFLRPTVGSGSRRRDQWDSPTSVSTTSRPGRSRVKLISHGSSDEVQFHRSRRVSMLVKNPPDYEYFPVLPGEKCHFLLPPKISFLYSDENRDFTDSDDRDLSPVLQTVLSEDNYVLLLTLTSRSHRPNLFLPFCFGVSERSSRRITPPVRMSSVGEVYPVPVTVDLGFSTCRRTRHT